LITHGNIANIISLLEDIYTQHFSDDPSNTHLNVAFEALFSQRDEQGRSALHKASLVGDDTIVDALLRHCFPIDVLDNDSNTSLHLAVLSGDLPTVKFLVRFGAQFLPNKQGKLPQQTAQEQNLSHIQQYFQEHMDTLSKPDNEDMLVVPPPISASSKRRLVVGICGSTCSGKSTLTKLLVKHFKCVEPYHHLDNYWKLASAMRTRMGFVDGENPEALRMDDFIESLARRRQMASEDRILFVDGFLLYSNQKIIELLDVKMFVSISKSTCFERRLARNRGTSKLYFEKIIWPSYLTYNADYVDFKCGPHGDDTLVLDGERRHDEIFNEAVHYLQQKLHN